MQSTRFSECKRKPSLQRAFFFLCVCFGSEEYSKEELIAEIGAATLMTRTGFETKSSFNNSVSYIQSWLKALQNDKRMIVSAAGKAEKAVKLIMDEEENAA